jgi:predicted enzyme related to lactoylglutathione lyase
MAERANPMIFVDIPSPDPAASSAFYAELFGWKVNERPKDEFHEILPQVKPNLGIHREETPISGPVPRIYVMVDDPPAYLERAVAMGATKLWDEVHWAEFDGRHAGFRDPWGAEIVLWRDKGTYTAGAENKTD